MIPTMRTQINTARTALAMPVDAEGRLLTSMGYVNSTARNIAFSSCRQKGSGESCPCCTRFNVAVVRIGALVLDLRASRHNSDTAQAWQPRTIRVHVDPGEELGGQMSGSLHRRTQRFLQPEKSTRFCAALSSVCTLPAAASCGTW